MLGTECMFKVSSLGGGGDLGKYVINFTACVRHQRLQVACLLFFVGF